MPGTRGLLCCATGEGADSDEEVWVSQGNRNNNRSRAQATRGILKKTPE